MSFIIGLNAYTWRYALWIAAEDIIEADRYTDARALQSDLCKGVKCLSCCRWEVVPRPGSDVSFIFFPHELLLETIATTS